MPSDVYLMAIAIGSSCAFLAPAEHQDNTLVLGARGFHFGDFWRPGPALEAIVLLVGVPVLLCVRSL